MKTQIESNKNNNNNLIKKTNITQINIVKNKNSNEKNNINKNNNEYKRNNKKYNTHKTEINKDKKNNKDESNKHILSNMPPKRKNEKNKTSSILKKSNRNEIHNEILLQKRNKTIKIKTNVEKSYINLDNNSFKNTSKNSKIKMLNQNKNKIDISIYNTKKDKKKSVKKKEKEKLDDYQLNDLDYLEAIELDKRPFSRIYWTTLKRNQLILFTFFSWNDYNISYVKFARFIFLVCTDMAMNVFFFTDESMHKIYLNYGKYNFIQQIPQIVYSTILSQSLELFLCYLSFTDKHIYQIKKLQTKIRNKDEIFKILKCIKIKLVVFYAFIFVIFIFYWYLISCFCAVYENTQIIFIKDSISSFFTGLIYQFAIYLMPSVLRIIALKDEKKNSKCIYKMSDIIPFF